jgi:hypothetical protein
MPRGQPWNEWRLINSERASGILIKSLQAEPAWLETMHRQLAMEV